MAVENGNTNGLGRHAASRDERRVVVRGQSDVKSLVMNFAWDCGGDHGITTTMALQHISSHHNGLCCTAASVLEELCATGWLRRVGQPPSVRYYPILTREEHTARLLQDALIDGGCSKISPSRTVA